MSQGNDFANYAGSADGQATPSSDVWFVAVASDDIKQMNVDQLDEAFRLGIISAETAVWTEGMEAWAPLGEVADLGGDDSSSEGSSEPEAAHHLSAAEGAHHGASAGAAFGASSFGSSASSFGSSASSFGSSASLASGPSSVAPVTASFAPAASNAPFVQSTVPVALNVDEDMPPIHVGRRWRPARWLLAAAAVAGLGVTAYNSGLLASSPAQVASAAAQPTEAKPASRAYDVGDGVEKGSSLPSTAEPETAPAAKPAGDDPIGASSALSAKEASAQEAAPAAKAAPGLTAAAPAKESLKGNFTKAFNKKAAATKPRAAKPRKASSRAAAKSAPKKKAGGSKPASAFDPLNDSLP